VIVELADSSGNIVDTAVTTMDGHYLFAGLAAGTYTVRESDPAGYFSSTDNTVPVSIDSGGSASANFGDMQNIIIIRGTVYDDRNGNGIQNSGEPGLPGVTVSLTDVSGNIVATTVTDVNGNYSFSGITPGFYVITEKDPSGYSSTTPNTVAVSINENAETVTDFGDQRVFSPPVSPPVIPPDPTDPTDPPEPEDGNITGIVFNDENGNGVQDPGEEGIGGVTILITDEDGNPVAEFVTGEDGSYSFGELPPGTYLLTAEDPAGYDITTENPVPITVEGDSISSFSFGFRTAAEADIRAEKTGTDINGDRLMPGDFIEYRIVIRNTGTGAAGEMVFTDEIPAHTSFVQGSLETDAGTIENEHPVRIAIPGLETGAEVNIQFRVQVSADAPENAFIINQGIVETEEGEIRTDNPATPEYGDPVFDQVGAPQIYDPPRGYKIVIAGRPFLYWEMVWINDSNMDAVLVHIEDMIPDGTTYEPGSLGADYGDYRFDEQRNVVVWEGDIPGNGGQVRIWFRITIPEDMFYAENQACAIWDKNGNGDWRDEAADNVQEICTDDPDTNPLGDPTVWQEIPSLLPPSAVKSVSGEGPVIHWEMVWTNDRNAAAMLLHVEDLIPEGTVYIGGSLGADYGAYWYDPELNRIIWEDTIPGNGGKVKIWFDTLLTDGIRESNNLACAFWDENTNGDWRDEAGAGQTVICTDNGVPTVWKAPPEEAEIRPLKPF
jgi:uncharacterized repeat protein (TIGR01451 family)